MIDIDGNQQGIAQDTPPPRAKASRRRRLQAGSVALACAAILGSAVAAAPSAMAAASYCNRSTCGLANSAGGAFYFQMPRNTPVTMKCWTDSSWYNGTNRWFQTSSIYGTGFMSASEVGSQTSTPHC